MATLSGMKVAILAAEGFEQAELIEPRKALEEAGAETRVISPAKGEVQGWKHFDKGERIKVDVPLEQADAGVGRGKCSLARRNSATYLRRRACIVQQV